MARVVDHEVGDAAKLGVGRLHKFRALAHGAPAIRDVDEGVLVDVLRARRREQCTPSRIERLRAILDEASHAPGRGMRVPHEPQHGRDFTRFVKEAGHARVVGANIVAINEVERVADDHSLARSRQCRDRRGRGKTRGIGENDEIEVASGGNHLRHHERRSEPQWPRTEHDVLILPGGVAHAHRSRSIELDDRAARRFRETLHGFHEQLVHALANPEATGVEIVHVEAAIALGHLGKLRAVVLRKGRFSARDELEHAHPPREVELGDGEVTCDFRAANIAKERRESLEFKLTHDLRAARENIEHLTSRVELLHAFVKRAKFGVVEVGALLGAREKNLQFIEALLCATHERLNFTEQLRHNRGEAGVGRDRFPLAVDVLSGQEVRAQVLRVFRRLQHRFCELLPAATLAKAHDRPVFLAVGFVGNRCEKHVDFLVEKLRAHVAEEGAHGIENAHRVPKLREAAGLFKVARRTESLGVLYELRK